jgi:lysozyme
MRLSDKGLLLITSFEGFPNGGRPYNDPSRYSTVGYGHLIAMRPVNDNDRGDVWVTGQRTPGRLSQPEAMRLLRADLGDYEAGVMHAVTRRITQGQFDALVSFAFNVGVGALRGSTLLRRLNAGDAAGAANEFQRWSMSAGRRLPGLVRRRAAERALFLSAHTDALAGYPPNEVEMIRHYDALHREHVSDARTRQLIAQMTDERKRIWRAAQQDGWDRNRRHDRYHSLLVRTTA